MASNVAYLPSVSSTVTGNRYTSPTTPMRRPSFGLRIVAGCVMFFRWTSFAGRLWSSEVSSPVTSAASAA